jgi:voltage-gated potassium channel Kch
LVAKYLHERRLIDSTSGRLSIGILIFQDIWAIIFLAVQPSFANPSLAPIALTFIGTAVVAVLAVLGARLVLRHGFAVVARSPELVVSLALAWCFGVGLFGANLGRLAHAVGIAAEISVSLEMGALIAGATIATSPYAYEVVARVIHLRDFFVTLFFVGLGMSIPVPDGAAVVLLAVAVAAVAVALRFLVFLPLLYATGLDRRNAVATSAKLAQVSEFCLVIVYLGAKLGHVGGDQVSEVIFAFVLTALATPFFFAASDRLYLRLRGVLDRLGVRSRGVRPEAEAETQPRLVLLGFHRVASALVAELERVHPSLVASTLVIDINAAVHDQLRARGVQVVYGDIGNAEVLRHAGVESAEVIVATVPDELLKGVTNLSLVRLVRSLAPEAKLFACATRASDASTLRAAGADHVFRPPSEVAQGLVPAIGAALDGAWDGFAAARADDDAARASGAEIID